ncbi:MAG: MHYT domain-containing protein [Pseudomonadota bacterium]
MPAGAPVSVTFADSGREPDYAEPNCRLHASPIRELRWCAISCTLAIMQFLDASHSPGLVAASIVVAIIAGFTGLSLTRNLSRKSIGQRKAAVALAAVALGGGIWSMHFVAMLGLQLPILFYYDVAITLASALLAILIVGLALILLHFIERSPRVIFAAGALVGAGIICMHYLGMSALQLCRAVHTVPGVALSLVVAVVLCVLAFWVAYNRRTDRNLMLGTLCFGGAVVSVHFVAMAGTDFVAVEGFSEFGPIMSNEILAIGVILSSFLIFGTFLWVGVTYLTPPTSQAAEEPRSTPVAEVTPPNEPPANTSMRVPCEKDGGKIFILPNDVAVVRADGHYTQIYTDEDRLFCAWPITEAAKRLSPAGLILVHRSYLVNPEKVAAFVRKKDSGLCTFTSDRCPQVPVSRSKLKTVQAMLGA